MKLLAKWTVYKDHEWDKCPICGVLIHIKPFLGKGVQVHTNIAQNPENHYFCSKECKMVFATSKI